jgi:endoglycosylceramidase
VNVANCAKSTPGFVGWHTKADFARMQKWGFNCVRYLVFWEAVEPKEGAYDETYIDSVIERIRWMEELGIDVVIDFHQDLYARKFTGNGFPDWAVHDNGIPFHQRSRWNYNYFEKAVLRSYEYFWASRTLQDRYIDMVEHFVRRVDALPNVAGVDIMNEPFPGINLHFESGALSAFYTDMQAMWRRNVFSAPMLFEPVMYNSGGLPTGLTFQPGARCVFAPHYYDPLCHEGYGYGRFAKFWMRLWARERAKDAQRFHTPLLYGEFGIASAIKGHLAYLSDFLDLLDQYQASWTYYSYDKSGAESFGIVDEAGNERDNLGVLVRAYPQRIAGDTPVFRQEGNHFDLSYKANDAKAPTVVFVPPRLKGVKAIFNGHAVSPDSKTDLLHLDNEGGPGVMQKLYVVWE